MTYDPLVPSHLKQLQQWFGGIISTPLQEDDHALTHVQMAHYLLPNPTLSALKGMEIYQQHYWWRLFNALQAYFPTLTRLLGIGCFNGEIAKPFLCSFPPSSWSLKAIGDGLPNWIKQSDRKDREWILQVAEIDLAYLKGGVAEQLTPFSPTLAEEDFHLTLKLQPHLTLFKLSGNLFQWRNKLLQKDSAYWSKHPPPKLMLKKEPIFFILYRTLDNRMHYAELSKNAFRLLERFQTGLTLESLCEKLESDDEPGAEDFDRWLGEWIKRGWLAKIQEKLPI